MTQDQLAKLLGKTSTLIVGYEKGKTVPPLEMILQLCEVFQVEIKDLILTNLALEEMQSAEPEETVDQKQQSKNHELLNEMLLKRVRELEREFKALDPDRAKRLGID